MKYIITESKMKTFLKKKFDLDLSDKITMVTSKFDLPEEFWWFKNEINFYLKYFSPMFLFKTPIGKFLIQDRGKDNWIIVNENDVTISESKLMEILGIEDIGLNIGHLIEIYLSE